MSKFTDFVDSFFFVLRKKNNQLTFLHVVHHSSMPVFSWFGPKEHNFSNIYYNIYGKIILFCKFSQEGTNKIM